MSDRTSIIKNTAWLFTAETVGTVLLSFGGIFLARAWGDATYGIYGFAVSFVALFGFLIDFGLSTLLVNQLAQHREDASRYIKNYTALKVILAVISLALIALFIGFTDKPAEVKMIVILLGCNSVIASFMTFYYSVYRAFEQMRYEALFKMASNVLSVGLIAAVLAGRWQLRTFIVATVLLTLGNLMVLVRLLARTHPVRNATFEPPFIGRTFRHAVPIALSTVFVSIYFYLDTVMLSFWKTNETVGWYTADYRIVLLIMTFMGLFYAATFPVISRLLNRDDQAVRVILAMSLRIIVTLVLPATIAISLLAPQFIGLLFGGSFVPGALALSILIWTVFVSGLSVVYSQTVLISRHKVVYAVGTAFGAALNTGLNFLLIPRWSLNGAAAATVATELALLVYFAIFCNRRVVSVPLERRLIAPTLLSLALVPLFVWARSWPVHFLVSGIAIGALYFALLFATRAVTRRDITDVIASLRSKEPRTP